MPFSPALPPLALPPLALPSLALPSLALPSLGLPAQAESLPEPTSESTSEPTSSEVAFASAEGDLPAAASQSTDPKVTTSRLAQYLCVLVQLPGKASENVGVLLLLPDEDRLYLKFRRDWLYFAGPEFFPILSELADDLKRQSEETGAAAFLARIESSWSNFLQLSERRTTLCLDPEKTLSSLYRREVSPEILRFETHAPLYSLRAAATKFGPERDADQEPEEWLEIPDSVRLSENDFCVRIVGRSMEPRIPDGCVALFRAGVKGSRQGRILLVEYRDRSGGSGKSRAGSYSGVQYTVKRYSSRKVQTEEGWQHEEIRLEPLNPEFEAFTLQTDDEFSVVGEFIAVISRD
jgi:SOS-response transcriptional repressor LexA